jgi:hypothetical protein
LVYFTSIKSGESFISNYRYIGGINNFEYDYIDDLKEIPFLTAIPGHNSEKFFKKLYKLLYPE